MIKYGIPAGEPGIYLSDLSAKYTQLADGEDDSENLQSLKIQALGPEHGDPYFVISTDRWAIDSKEELIEIMDHYLSLTK